MNCFEFRNRASDYLDGTLMDSQKHEADLHLESCAECRHSHARYRQILSALARQPRASLPMPIHKAPLSFILPGMGAGVKSSRWERTPWMVRSSVEGLGVAFLILGFVAMVPRIRSWYEKGLERNLGAYDLAEITPGLKKSDPEAPQLSRGKAPMLKDSAVSDEFAGEDDDYSVTEEAPSSAHGDAPDVRVGSSEIWRFNLRTDSPHDVQPQIVKTLTSLHIPANTPGLGGTEAPGGIQFDLLVPQATVAPLKRQLQRLTASNAAVGTSPASQDSGGAMADFTWYKNKSKRPIPAGKARVVIWLSLK